MRITPTSEKRLIISFNDWHMETVTFEQAVLVYSNINRENYMQEEYLKILSQWKRIILTFAKFEKK